ncbi:hypothetical protein FNF29_05443 [Cafeteria roenbergensis]|uniref:Uncharacterized protein n=1 Tax=Cafeteria roenbergensis TaxID=33653 RepID=A0A5A8CAQ6_CAFRO|nr:hypothetical protein FNF29_05443 [Cafeteria roenbergensis]|eukprot:KAA0150203.1 hypothetical protein FNF29_05443 [Cafeteria roenbergensis]
MSAAVPSQKAAAPPAAPGAADDQGAIADLLGLLASATAGADAAASGSPDEDSAHLAETMATLQRVLEQAAGGEVDLDAVTDSLANPSGSPARPAGTAAPPARAPAPPRRPGAQQHPAGTATAGPAEGSAGSDGEEELVDEYPGRFDDEAMDGLGSGLGSYRGPGGGAADDEDGHYYDEDGYPVGGHDAADADGRYYGEDEYDEEEPPLVEMRSGVWPVDAWRAQHEQRAAGAAAPRPKSRTLSSKDWDELVTRLNESSKRKQQALSAIRAKRDADELASSRRTPAISRRSKQIASAVRRLPDRVNALMARRKRKLDKLRDEAHQREMAEVSLKPKLARPINGRMAHLMKRMRRRVGHLLQYDVDKQIRARQRQQIMQEVEARELTFSPRINPNSVRIFNKMQRRINTIRSKIRTHGPESLTPEERQLAAGGKTKAARSRTEADNQLKLLAELEADVKSGRLSRIPLGKDGLSKLPGHEEERFHPRINPRSRRFAQEEGPDDVHERLYSQSTEAHAHRTMESRAKAQATLRLARTKSSAALGLGNSSDGLRVGSIGLKGASIAASSAAASIASGDAGLGDGFENLVAYRPGYDFIVRHVLNAQAAGDTRAVDEEEAAEAAAAAAAAGGGAGGGGGLGRHSFGVDAHDVEDEDDEDDEEEARIGGRRDGAMTRSALGASH